MSGRTSKHDRDRSEVETFKERFRKEPTAALLKRQQTGALLKAAAIAIREVLAERSDF